MLSAPSAWGALPEVHQVDGGGVSWSSWLLVVVVVVEGMGAQRGACYTHSSGWGMKSFWQPASGSTQLRECAVGFGPTSKDNTDGLRSSGDLTVAMVVRVMRIWVVVMVVVMVMIMVVFVMVMMMVRNLEVIKGMLKMLTTMTSGTRTEKDK